MNKIVYSIWLIPTNNDRKYFDKIIASLAKKYGVYTFLPHLTVYGVVRTPKEKIKQAIDYALTGINKFCLKVNKCDYSDIFIKTLFIQFEFNDTLLQIYNKLRSKLRKYLIDCKEYDLNPHMSLIYKHGIPDEEKEGIIRSIKMKKEFIFDRCCILSEAKPIEKEKDVKDWAIAYDRTF